MDIWEKLYAKAKSVLNGRTISPFIDAGGVASCLITKSGNMYVGVCIDTCCGLGMCAERNAISNMITNGEHEIDKIICVMSDGSTGYPCGACLEMMMQLDKDSGDIEIMVDYENEEVVLLKDLMKNWWGSKRF